MDWHQTASGGQHPRPRRSAGPASETAKAALLDLRTLKRGTVVEMEADAVGGMGGLVKQGMRIQVADAHQERVLVTWDVDGKEWERWVVLKFGCRTKLDRSCIHDPRVSPSPHA